MALRAGLRRAALGAACLSAAALAAGPGAADWIDYHEFSGRVSVDGRWYPQSGDHLGQRSHASGFAVSPRLYLEDEEGRSLTLEGFHRLDTGDPHRTHADLRVPQVGKPSDPGSAVSSRWRKGAVTGAA